MHTDPAEGPSLPSTFGAWGVKPAPLPRTIPRSASTRPTVSAIRDRSSCAYAIGAPVLAGGSVWDATGLFWAPVLELIVTAPGSVGAVAVVSGFATVRASLASAA